ncbi:fam-b protein [Plasmodium chabaudi chabaudi]|uniref:Fam-b protein n=1 Tax=Plasmodium chabaudi chabaudi TaxID=31271 RepID=A0A4V0K392_PLACU|nr:fam-b protein [Plasmodium chabaudi chabaudi]VTZ66942.1 fam-b protein [Plasmodium chabaudi chabaudi]|eukprot:XP_744717.1 fam-b protein [Plasmodium chabaudi chabaudi]
MRVSILKYVLFSSTVCSFEYSQNELHYANERSIYLERNVINFRNNRILADVDNQFDLNNFYESTLDFLNEFNDYNDDDEEMACLLNMIGSHVNKNKENHTIFNLNNVDEETKNLIYELQKELEEVKKELDNIRNSELEIQSIQDKKITKKDEYNFVSEHEGIKQLGNEGAFLEIDDDNFEDKYYEIISSNIYKKLKINQKLIEAGRRCIMASLSYIVSCFMYVSAGWGYFSIMHIPYIGSILMKWYKFIKLELKRREYT